MSAEQAWGAVLSRDRSHDGRLFYGVTTTRIYCRPSCPSRRPARRNAVFFTTARQAEQAGFRACHRCHPDSISGTTTERRLRRALDYIDRRLEERVTLQQLGKAVGLSPFHLQRAFKETVGLSPRAYQKARRLERMKAQLRNGDDVSRAAWQAGFGSSRAAYETASTGLGMTPGQYKRGARDVPIKYALERTELGHLIVGWTDSGVCAVLLADSRADAIASLKDEFPAAQLSAVSEDSAAWIRAVLDYLDGSDPGLAIPLDLRGSNFQLRVWNALQQIPVGEVRSYSEIAAAVGVPKSVRAVARAIATNKAAIVVPCHRAIRADGSISGYRWGVERKRQLLQHEQQLRQKAQS